MFYQRLISLCTERGTTPTEVCHSIGLAGSAATKWKSGTIPRDTTLQKIADHFGTTVSYLNGLVDDPDPISLVDPSKKEPPMLERLNEVMKDMTEEELADLEKYVEFLLSKKKGGNS